jgi:assimilatory nitrate reductase catalytic subunit
VANARGEVHCTAEYSTAQRLDTVFLPFHFPGRQGANLLTSSATDPVSGMPEFKTSSVTVSPAPTEMSGIVGAPRVERKIP